MSTNNDNKKEFIIAAAIRRFAHYGFSKTTMNEIAEDVKITKANLYYYYPDKTTLVHDVILSVTDDFRKQEQELIKKSKSSVINLLLDLLDLKSAFIERHYMLHMNENMEWIKGAPLQTLMRQIHEKEVIEVAKLFQNGVDNKELAIEDVHKTSEMYVYLMKSIGLVGILCDVFTGIPTQCNVGDVLQKQKDATMLIYNGLKFNTVSN
ncbi:MULTISPECIES: TetR/AcrR family transcriptional regulator [Sphingobacterium]|uniref:TetR/AcrR family transcriptional regulator n=1 Tax=Sphingobacterium TaxID=28453 RepID=UPI00038A3E21|nr:MULTISPECIES: TetR/AcrR family transcriptional regulator [Sphingobacterium]KKX49288.1 transcriptional regulator [Sphingobacterium sp. IITKGP-BTPF85]MCW2263902.1 TetR/AcrR family transcriptional repressor of mexJK operon [Sphingobacterium kitahiroshimense]NJI73364.1 TetR/AcrR family transcriptional regulator [Sphingobacterium sp. B16(2022)]TCR01652.1 TetR family transcriptional regulator [Sphingobacterium sp. JUb78]